MIKVLKRGRVNIYSVDQDKILLVLDDKRFIWQRLPLDKQLLKSSIEKPQQEKHLAEGCYRYYEIDCDKRYSDGLHLEILFDEKKWQGYILPSGLPKDKESSRIISIAEIVTISR